MNSGFKTDMSNSTLIKRVLLEDLPLLESAAGSFCAAGLYVAEINCDSESNFYLNYLYPVDKKLNECDVALAETEIFEVIGNVSASGQHSSHQSLFIVECNVNGNKRTSGKDFFVFRPTQSALTDVLIIGIGEPGLRLNEKSDILNSILTMFMSSVERGAEVVCSLAEKPSYNKLFTAAPEAIAILDSAYCVIDVNPEFEKLFLYEKKDILGRNLDKLIASGPLLKEAKSFSTARKDESYIAVESKRMRRDGSLVDVSILAVPFNSANGDLYAYGFYRDISERKNNEKQKLARIAFIEYISKLSSELINLNIGQIDEAVVNALQRVAQMYGAERAYLAYISENRNVVEVTHEWTVDQRLSHKSRQPCFPVNEVEVFGQLLKNGQTFYLQREDIGVVEGTEELRFYFDLLDIESLAIIPLFIDLHFKGFIGFDMFSKPAKWDKQTIDSFKLVGQILINAIGRKETEQTIKLALEKAEASDKLKSAFLAGISHEVRTPMNHILGFLELLNEPYITLTEQSEYIKLMKSSGLHLLRLIDDVIELAMIDSGQIIINERPCDISRLMESLLIEFEGIKVEMSRPELKLSLTVSPECRGTMFYTDEIRLRQILWNLLSNAIKYTHTGNVDIGIERSDDSRRLNFFVRDTGIGIEEKDLSLIFERFRQVDAGYERAYGGAGLGLSICQGLAVLFGDKIHVKTELGKGSVFSFSIPSIVKSDHFLGSGSLGNGQKNYEWNDKTILLVEDDPVNMRFLMVILLKTEATLLYASNGNEAIQILAGNKVDLVLMDMQMPLMDGYEATAIMKKQFPEVPVIAQTAFAMKDDKKKCTAAGCDEFISKPIDKNSLYVMIESLFKKQKLC